ncbi:MAG TPA: cytochrome c-type biogenesis protein [Ktedonobacterales bacterium]|nr:cytochrome c-type biogenesis protein [Ktedonobacterales bacterium]
MNWRTLTHFTRQRSLLVAAGVLLVVGIVWAMTLAAPRPPATLDQRVADVAAQLQCLVCQGESVADSPSLFAQDVRGVIRARLRQGQSDQQVLDYLVGIYGDRIRESPPKSGFTLLIWLGPLAMLLAGIIVVFSVARQWRATAELAGASAESDPELESLSDGELDHYRALLAAELDLDELPPRTPARGVQREIQSRATDAGSRTPADSRAPSGSPLLIGEGSGERSEEVR